MVVIDETPRLVFEALHQGPLGDLTQPQLRMEGR